MVGASDISVYEAASSNTHGEAPSDLLSDEVREGGPNEVYVRPSPIHGVGLFARRTFATGETILVREERRITPEEPLAPEHGELEMHCDRIEGGRLVYLGYPSRHINHSCDANAFLRRQDGLSHLIALKPIRPNEEIVRNYGVNRWHGERMQCNCGTEQCVGELPEDFFGLPLAMQVELSPLLSSRFVFEHREAYRGFLQEVGLTEDDLR